MIKTIKKLTAILFFCIGLVGIIYLAYGILSWKDTCGDYNSSTIQLYNTEDNLIDVFFLGSSHCYCSVYPSYIWEKKGIAAFDMAVSGQNKVSTYHYLIEALKTQKPKVVCVELFGLTSEEYGIEGNLYRNMLSMKTSANSVSHLQDYFGDENFREYLLKWPIIHSRYAELGKNDFVENNLSKFGRGEDFEFVTTEDYVWLGASEEDTVSELGESNLQWLDKLYELANEADFKLILFVAPYMHSVEEQQLFNAAEKYIADKDIVFLDLGRLSEELSINVESDFCDQSHLNAFGAKKVSEFFAEYLSKNYDLADHRGDEAYFQWELDKKYFEHAKAAYELKQIDNASEYIDKLLTMEDICTVISMEANDAEKTRYYSRPLSKLGIKPDQVRRGGKWIYRDGVCEKIMENDIEEAAYVEDLTVHDTLRVRFMGDLDETNISINQENFNQRFYNLTIFTYDTFVGEVLDSFGN